MKRFTVKARTLVHYKTEIEAVDLKDAEKIANSLDGGVFLEDGADDWEIICVEEVS